MTPHDLGQELRQLVLRDRRQGQSMDPRRLQAAISDLCGVDHAELVAPLRCVVLSAPFASALAQDPPLADPRLLGRLQQELSEIYAAPLCQRVQPVLQGLLGLAGPSVRQPLPLAGPAVRLDLVPQQAGPPASPGVDPALGTWQAPAAGAPPAGGGSAPEASGWAVSADTPPVARSGLSGLQALLAFLSGMLLMALAGIGLWVQQRPTPRTASGPAPAAGGSGGSGAPVAPAPPAAAPAAVPASAPSLAPAASEAGNQETPSSGAGGVREAEVVDRALASVNALYAALSAKDYGRARGLFGAAAADQFDPAFFDQFARVTVQDLRLISQSGSSVNLEGVVSFVYPDGAIQTETRTFTLDASTDPVLITASEFGRVIKPR